MTDPRSEAPPRSRSTAPGAGGRSGPGAASGPRSFAAELGIRIWSSRPGRIGILLVAALVVFAAAGPVLWRVDPLVSDFSLVRGAAGAPPGMSWAHPLGTDPLFRDVLARLAHGARLSLSVALAATLVASVIGTGVGLLSGWLAGTRLGAVDALLMRVVDVLLALPFLLFVTAIGVAVGRADATTMLLVLGLTGWTGMARVVRAKTLELRELDYVAAARALGNTGARIVVLHILPNLATTVAVVATSAVAHMILAEAVLGYLTVGVPPPTASWGRMLHESEAYLSIQPALLAAPGIAILVAVLGFNRLGDGIQDALDPRRAPQRGHSLPSDVALVAAALLLVTVARPGPLASPIGDGLASDAAPRRGGVLHLASHVNLRSLEPAVAYDEGASVVFGLVLDRLLTFDESGRLVPDLAERWDTSVDGRTLTFTLPRGVRFHDGAELTAADVKRSLERMLHPKTPSPGASLYESIVGFREYHEGKSDDLAGVRVLGTTTLAIDLVEPDATFASLLTLPFAAPVCPSSGARVDAKTTTPPCGTGPFRVVRWSPDSGVVLERHEGYRVADMPHLDGVQLESNIRPTTQRYRFEAGELDLVIDLAPTDVARYLADPAWRDRGRWVAQKATNAIYLNTEMEPFRNRALRRAVALAVDPSKLSVIRPDVVANDRVLPDSVSGPARDRPMRHHDRDSALAEMARAGYPFDPTTGRGGYPSEIEYLTVPDSFEQAAGEIYQQQLAAVGLRIRLKLVTWATYLAESSRRGASAMGWAGWQADFPDPANFFEPNLASASISDEQSSNRAFFSHPELDAVLAKAHRERDEGARMRLYARAEEIVRDEAPWVPTHVSRRLQLWHPYVHGYVPHPIAPLWVRNVWLGPRADAMRPLGAGVTP